MENCCFKNIGLSEGKLIKTSTQTGQFGGSEKKRIILVLIIWIIWVIMGHHFSLPPSLFFLTSSSSNRLQTASGWSPAPEVYAGAGRHLSSNEAWRVGFSDLRGLSAEPWRGILRESSDKGSPRDHCHFYGWDKRAGNYWDESRESLWKGTAFSLSLFLSKDLLILLTLSSGQGLGTNSVGSDPTSI